MKWFRYVAGIGALCVMGMGAAWAETQPPPMPSMDGAGELDVQEDFQIENVEQESNMVIIKTSKGDIKVKLNEEKAPLTVANFLKYVDDGHYDGTIFHRVIGNFMIQGGGFDKNMVQKPTKAPIKNEAANGLQNKRGTLAMARTSVVDSATSQFFINVVDNGFLDFKSPDPRGFGYCVFGEVVDGMDVVDQIRGVRTTMKAGMQDVPAETVEIISIRRAE